MTTIKAMPDGRVRLTGPCGGAFMTPLLPTRWYLFTPPKDPDAIVTSTFCTDNLAEAIRFCEQGVWPEKENWSNIP
jgi:hypothetical protein